MECVNGMIKRIKQPQDSYEWHDWYAWRPVTIKKDEVQYRVWLEHIQRKERNDPWATSYDYRFKEQKVRLTAEDVARGLLG